MAMSYGICFDFDEELVERLQDITKTEFRPPGVTHSAPLGRRSFLQIPPPLRVSLKWAGSERFL